MEVKKYGNRRLYDSEGSRYLTLEEIAERVRLGEDLRVVDAKTGHDLTQVTLAQLILESRGAARLLPTPLLKQLLRMRDDALAEFFGRYVAWALEVYLRLKQGARMWNPLAGLGAPDLLARLLRQGPAGDEPPPPPYPDEPPPPASDDLADLRRELADLRRAVQAREPEARPARKPARPAASARPARASKPAASKPAKSASKARRDR